MSKKNDIVWEDPPEPVRGPKGVWRDRLEPLMKHPGRWAKFGPFGSQGGPSMAHWLRKGTKYNRPPGEWQFTGRRVGDESYIYARYIGPEQEQTEAPS